jgi:hypothetical protein
MNIFAFSTLGVEVVRLLLSSSIARFMAEFLRGLASSWPVGTTSEILESGSF